MTTTLFVSNIPPAIYNALTAEYFLIKDDGTTRRNKESRRNDYPKEIKFNGTIRDIERFRSERLIQAYIFHRDAEGMAMNQILQKFMSK